MCLCPYVAAFNSFCTKKKKLLLERLVLLSFPLKTFIQWSCEKKKFEYTLNTPWNQLFRFIVHSWIETIKTRAHTYTHMHTPTHTLTQTYTHTHTWWERLYSHILRSIFYSLTEACWWWFTHIFTHKISCMANILKTQQNQKRSVTKKTTNPNL